MTEPEKRPPSLTKDIRTLYLAADWPEGCWFRLTAAAEVECPDGEVLPCVGEPAAAEFIVEAANYMLRHLREIEAREASKGSPSVSGAPGYAGTQAGYVDLDTAAEQQAREGKGRRR